MADIPEDEDLDEVVDDYDEELSDEGEESGSGIGDQILNQVEKKAKQKLHKKKADDAEEKAGEKIGEEAGKKTGETLGKNAAKKTGEELGKEATKKTTEALGKEPAKKAGEAAISGASKAGTTAGTSAGATAGSGATAGATAGATTGATAGTAGATTGAAGAAGTAGTAAGAAGTAGAAGGAAAGGAAAGAGAAAGTTAAAATTTAAAGAGAAGTGAAAGAAAVAWPVLIVIGIILAVILVILLVIIFSTAIAAALDQQDQEDSLSFSTFDTSLMYGYRLIYTDEDILSDKLQLSYKQYTIDVLTYLDEQDDITLNIILPDEEFDNKTEIDENIINISIGIGNLIATGSNNYIDVNFIDLYPDIQYFGFTSTQVDDINSFINSYLTDKNLLTIANNSSVNIEDLINNASQSENFAHYYNICEKVIIQDIIPTDEDVPNFGKHKFIGCIYMPRENINTSSMAYRIKGISENDEISFKAIYQTNTQESIMETTADTSWNENTIFVEAENYNSTTYLSKFTLIDAENPAKYSNPTSLFEAINLQPDGAEYFSNTKGIYTWQPSGNNLLILTFTSSNNQPFTFNEFYIEMWPN